MFLSSMMSFKDLVAEIFCLKPKGTDEGEGDFEKHRWFFDIER